MANGKPGGSDDLGHNLRCWNAFNIGIIYLPADFLQPLLYPLTGKAYLLAKLPRGISTQSTNLVGSYDPAAVSCSFLLGRYAHPDAKAPEQVRQLLNKYGRSSTDFDTAHTCNHRGFGFKEVAQEYPHAIKISLHDEVRDALLARELAPLVAFRFKEASICHAGKY